MRPCLTATSHGWWTSIQFNSTFNASVHHSARRSCALRSCVLARNSSDIIPTITGFNSSVMNQYRCAYRHDVTRDPPARVSGQTEVRLTPREVDAWLDALDNYGGGTPHNL